MSDDFNKSSFIGRLTRDSDLKYTNKGVPVVIFSIASNERILKDKEYTNFFECQLWGKYGESLNIYLKKGKLVLVDGTARQQRWKDQSGNIRSKIIFNVKKIQLLGKGITNE